MPAPVMPQYAPDQPVLVNAVRNSHGLVRPAADAIIEPVAHVQLPTAA